MIMQRYVRRRLVRHREMYKEGEVPAERPPKAAEAAEGLLVDL